MPASKKKNPAPIKFPPTGKLLKNWQRTVKLACKLPGVTEDRSYGTPALKVKGKLLARLRSEAEGGLALFCEFVEREMLLQADSDAFYITDHYRDHPMILVNLARVRWEAMPQLLESAWKMRATAAAVRKYEAGESG